MTQYKLIHIRLSHPITQMYARTKTDRQLTP